jgi:3-hydroxyisobutyrate dehydrogenase-like beta-hydroxyacid dehydrogenase
MNDKHPSPHDLNSGRGQIHVATRDRTAPAARRIAILGTGKMGSAIAARLSAAGFEVVLWNRTRSRAEALGLGTVSDTPAAAARDADIVISSLTGPEAVLAAYCGRDGALSAGEGKHFVEMSTAGPGLVSDLAGHITAARGTLVDAPILGAPPVVRAGEAAILVGGADDDVAMASPVLSLLGSVRHVGPLGSAARLKLVANSMLADVILAAAELQVAGEGAGLDPADVFWVLKRLAPALEARRAGIVEDRHTPPQFALRDLRKDLDLALALFGDGDAPTPLTRSSRELVSAAATVTPDLDISAVTRPYRQVPRSTSAAPWTATPLAAAAAR